MALPLSSSLSFVSAGFSNLAEQFKKASGQEHPNVVEFCLRSNQPCNPQIHWLWYSRW
jgi:hypothetical protein